jgi:hypothetical protein
MKLWSWAVFVAIYREYYNASAGSMTPKGLIAIGLTWFVAVVLWTCFFDRSVSLAWMAPSVFKKAVLVASFYLLT